jgi:hypothetical protein
MRVSKRYFLFYALKPLEKKKCASKNGSIPVMIFSLLIPSFQESKFLLFIYLLILETYSHYVPQVGLEITL